eukprot:CAMPEP_0113847110 /NCGR_PEP_ID=MMETSP0372-20130328/1685_1 /TAXON_ID=340204 /ORGANISM="Lankesteria abbotti" /LENGTH=175 /DNA_ID=CAMNT_0000816337 /DNA_START=75 /DNA_END=602 /DNA_ORIENTATION=- /assembly_acc=CAM_ASM_000359
MACDAFTIRGLRENVDLAVRLENTFGSLDGSALASDHRPPICDPRVECHEADPTAWMRTSFRPGWSYYTLAEAEACGQQMQCAALEFLEELRCRRSCDDADETDDGVSVSLREKAKAKYVDTSTVDRRKEAPPAWRLPVGDADGCGLPGIDEGDECGSDLGDSSDADDDDGDLRY